MAAETAPRVTGWSSTVFNLNGNQKRSTRFLALPPRASSSSSISYSLSQFPGSVRRLPIPRHQQGKTRDFSVFAMAAQG
ncbi:hypothetical protein PTKIN_Ptkin07bG0311400 [Pterospermum kingtungense]